MPMNSVASCMRLTSHEPQQKCIHCNTVPTGKYLTFDMTKYEQNTKASQMTENYEQNIICNKCHNGNLQRIPSYMSQMHKNYEKNVYIEI